MSSGQDDSAREFDPTVVGHATAVDGRHLTLFKNPFGAGQVAFDDDGSGPYVPITGCPNCGKHAGEWWDSIAYAAAWNSGANPNEPCSAVCKYQLEWQADIASRRLTEPTEGVA